MAKAKGKSEIQKLEKKIANIKSGKWNESPERIKLLENRLKKLKGTCPYGLDKKGV